MLKNDFLFVCETNNKMYKDDEILIIKYDYSKKTLQDRISKLTFDPEKIKILDVTLVDNKDISSFYLLINLLTNLHRVAINTQAIDFDTLLDRNLIIDLRFIYNGTEDMVTLIKSKISTRNYDKLNNILLFYCSKCNDNLFQETPNRCKVEFKKGFVNRKIHLCNRMLCNDCAQKCMAHSEFYDYHHNNDEKIDKDLRKLMYEASSNYFWFKSNYIKPNNTNNHLLSLDDCDCDYIKTEKKEFRYRLQLLKTSLTMILNNIPSNIVSKVENFLNCDYSYPGYRQWTTSEVDYCMKVVLKELTGKFDNRGWYKLSGPVLNLFADYGEIQGWYYIPDILCKIWYQNKLYQARLTMTDSLNNHQNKYNIEAMNLMAEKYQYPKCKCCDVNKNK